MKNILRTDKRGTYVRDLGYVEKDGSYKQPTFYLGKDRAGAQIAVIQLEQCWDVVCVRWQRDRLTPRPVWDCEGMAIARAVARGETAVALDSVVRDSSGAVLPVPAETVQYWLLQLRQDFARVRVVLNLADAAVQSEGQRRLEEAASRVETVKQWVRQTGAGGSLFAALDGYGEWVRAEKSVDGRLKPDGKNWLKQISWLKTYCVDVALAQFGLAEIETMIRVWRGRPLSKVTGQRFSINVCQNVIKRVRHFVRWLHKSPAWEWRKPVDLEWERVRIDRTQAERAALLTASQVQTYTVAELATLWEYAVPRERVFMALALNCGFGQAEIASLQTAEVAAGFIKRLRGKTEIYGEWQLWDVTISALAWYGGGSAEFFTAPSGRALTVGTAGNNRDQTIANAWAALLRRVRKDSPSFRGLSFNKLRKTAGELVKQVSDGETAAVFLSHAETNRDEFSDVYTNRQFGRVHAALSVLRSGLLSSVFSVADPFPSGRASNRSVSLAKIKKLRQMKSEGFTTKKIAADLCLNVETVRRYLRGS